MKSGLKEQTTKNKKSAMTEFSWDFGENSDETWKFHASQRFFLCQNMYKNQGVWFVKCLKNDRFFSIAAKLWLSKIYKILVSKLTNMGDSLGTVPSCLIGKMTFTQSCLISFCHVTKTRSIYMYIHSLESPWESTKNLFCFCWQGSSCWLSDVSWLYLGQSDCSVTA